MKYDNLRNRPFLIVYTIAKPASNVDTSKPKWNQQTGNWTLYERIEIVDRVKKKHLTDASIILDLIKGTMIKSRFDKPEDQIANMYITKYEKEIKAGMMKWMMKEGKDVFNHEAVKDVLAGMQLNEEDNVASS